VCHYRCVEEKVTQKYTCYETRKVACKATRTVRVCVPYEVEVECCRMVSRCVTRQVPECASDCCERSRLFGGRHNRGCDRGCDRGCNNGCDRGHLFDGLRRGDRGCNSCGGCR
jgi:hypothetical protein